MTSVSKDLLNRVRHEYLEMPGLLLTPRQASRFWNIDESVCEALLSALEHERFLAKTYQGAYLRCGAGRPRVHAAVQDAQLREPDGCDDLTPVGNPMTHDRAVPASSSPDDGFAAGDEVGRAGVMSPRGRETEDSV